MAAKRLRGASVISSVDSQGLLIEVLVSEANLSERLGGSVLVMEALPQIPNLELLWVDQGYSGPHFALPDRHSDSSPSRSHEATGERVRNITATMGCGTDESVVSTESKVSR